MIDNATITRNENGTVTVASTCGVTGKPYSVTVRASGFDAWQAGDFIQRAMPDVSEGDREFLISGTSPEGWKELFGEEDDIENDFQVFDDCHEFDDDD